MTATKNIAGWIVAGLSGCLMLSGCFTGVESTPKITAKEVHKKKVTDTPESHLLDNVVETRPSQWTPGRLFYVADNRAVRAALRTEPFDGGGDIEGKIVELVGIDTVVTLTGTQDVQLAVAADDGKLTMIFSTGMTPEQWRSVDSFSLPHFIDMETVRKTASELVGRKFYILPSRRLGHNGVDTIGTRYQEVTITDVLPSTEATPLRVYFADDEGHLSSVLMTIGDATTSRRNFETLFSIRSPRDKYKNISDETWERIRHSNIALGMTPEECRLALGSPDNYIRVPSTAGMVERWTYSNGVYLIFEDGVLSSFRL